MPHSTQVLVNSEDDERVLQLLAGALRRGDRFSKQLRDFADTIEEDPLPAGLRFEPLPGQLLACHFGLGFEVPENVKTRPVLVISPRQRERTGLRLVVPISSKPPREPRAHHYRLPDGLVPNDKYEESWIKGDMAISVGLHRLDRFKVGFRDYRAPTVPDEVLREARRCVLHAAGMDTLTAHW